MQSRVSGGYIAVTVGQLSSLCALKRAGKISFAAVRVYLSALEQRAKRCMAKRQVHFTVAELARLSGGLSERSVRAALAELEEHSLLTWSEYSIQVSLGHELGEEIVEKTGTKNRRPVPIPRRILRLLARHTKPSEVIAALAHLIRCLFKSGQKLMMKGFVRAEWVAEVFGVSVRAVYSTRKWLLGLGVLEQLPVHQFVLNKHGALFAVSTAMLRGKPAAKPKPPLRKSAGLPKGTSSTLKSTSNNQIKDKPACSGKAGFLTRLPRKISLTAIERDDLQRVSRLEELYQQAVRSRWLEPSDRNARNFVAAAVRATRASGNSAAIFVGIVKKKLWHHITHEQEDRAKEVLDRFCVKHPEAFRERHGGEKLKRAGESKQVRGMLREVQTSQAEIGDSWRHYGDWDGPTTPVKARPERKHWISPTPSEA